MLSNRWLTGSLLANLVLAIAVILLLRSCNSPCPEATIVKQWTDTIYKDPAIVLPSVFNSNPKPVKITHQAVSIKVTPNSQPGSVPLVASVPNVSNVPTGCSDLVEYLDTIYQPNEYKAIIHEIVTGNQLTRRKILFYNLTPEVVTHVEKTIPLKENIRVYAGIFTGFQASYSQKTVSNFRIGPEVVITIPAGLMVGYGFDARNNGHQINLLYKIKLRK